MVTSCMCWETTLVVGNYFIVHLQVTPCVVHPYIYSAWLCHRLLYLCNKASEVNDLPSSFLFVSRLPDIIMLSFLPDNHYECCHMTPPMYISYGESPMLQANEDIRSMLSAYNKSLLTLKSSLARASTSYHMYPCDAMGWGTVTIYGNDC